jgi:cyclic beta-1,2-glucan synthetase
MWFVPAISIVISSALISKHSIIIASENSDLGTTIFFIVNLLTASVMMAAWIFSPSIAWWLSEPFDQKFFEPETIKDLNTDDVDFLRLLARKTWRYFETFVREEDNYLPLDNF